MGFVLNHFIISEADDLPLYIRDRESSEGISWPILGCGFSDDNVLIWSYDLKGFSSVTSDCFIKITPDTAYEEGHRSLIVNSALKIVYLCGPRSESTIKAVIRGLS